MGSTVWKSCIEQLEGDLSPQQFNTWIRPLQAIEENNNILLYAPNRFVQDWINEQYLDQIRLIINKLSDVSEYSITVEVGNQAPDLASKKTSPKPLKPITKKSSQRKSSNLNLNFSFDSFLSF